MKISPYLDNLLTRWGNSARKNKAWYNECPYLKEAIGRTTRTPTVITDDDEVENIGKAIGNLVEPLRKSLEAHYKHKLKTNVVKANWCRCSKKDYKASFWVAIEKLEYFVAEQMTVNT
jgi:hypothetical protein